MTTVNLIGDNATRTYEKILRDPMVRNLLTKSSEEIITWWNNTATNADKNDLMLRVVLLVSGIMRGKIDP